MTPLKKNVLANLSGRFLNLAIVIGFFPVYLHLLGPEALGLVGVFNALFSVLSLMDLGVSGTLLRETARLSAVPGWAQQQRDLLRTTEVYYGLAAGTLAAALVVAAPYIAIHLHSSSSISIGSIRTSISLMGCTIALQLMLTLYQNALNGLERQSEANMLLVGAAAIRAVVTVLTLLFVSKTVEAFFICQLLITAASMPIAHFLTWHHTPRAAEPARIQIEILIKSWRYSGTLALNGLVGVILSQMDKIIIASLFPLRVLGYYTLANTATNIFWAIIAPVNTAFFPRFAKLKEIGATNELRLLFHRASQFMTFLIVPPAALLIFFSREIIELWTGDPAIAAASANLVALMVAGVALNGISSVSSYAQSALGFPQFILYSNLTALAVIPAAMFPLAKAFGPVGLAAGSVALNSLYLIIPPYLFHKRCLQQERWRWYFTDIGLLTLVGVATAAILRQAITMPTNRTAQIAFLLAMGCVIAIAVGGSAPSIRQFILDQFRKFMARKA